MWKQVKNYFLERFSQKDKTELKKAFYLLLSTFTVFAFLVFLSIGHLVFQPGGLYILGDLLGLGGCMGALYFFRQGNVDRAGKTLIAFVIIVFSIQVVCTDLLHTDPAIRYKLYVTLACILCTYFLFVSFFRNVSQLVVFTVLFIGLLTAHFLIILHQIGRDSKIASFAFEHYVVVCSGAIVAAILSGLLINLIEKLYTQAIEQGEVIRQQNDELREVIEQKSRFLVASNESLREFVYLTSHDLREPLRSISGFISLIKKDYEKSNRTENKENMDQYFEYVHQGVKQMEALIDDIKVYSSVNVLEKNFTQVSMNEVIAQVKTALAGEIRSSNAVIKINADLPEVTGEKSMLFTLLHNLISNALKYQKKGRTPMIEIRCEKGERKCTYAIRDNGIGIPEDYRDNIFLAFKRLHGKQSGYEGTGLGLAICKKIIEIHGGRIWVDSTLGVGSTFYFTLDPVAKDTVE